MSVFIGGPYGRLAIMLNMLSSLNIEIIIIIITVFDFDTGQIFMEFEADTTKNI